MVNPLVRNYFLPICCGHVARVESRLLAAGILSPGMHLEDLLVRNKLAARGETLFDIFERTTRFLAQAGRPFYGEQKVEEHQKRFLEYATRFQVILGSPIITNAGRRDEKSISACSIPPVKLSQMSRKEIAEMVGHYHSRGMGTGFSLDDLTDPVEVVLFLNATAVREVQKGSIERSVGNMGVLSIDHPRVREFIRVKKDHPEIKEWKFNISVNLTDAFITAWLNSTPFRCKEGTLIDPEQLMEEIAESAHATGDPGLVFMDRINRANRVPHAGTYKTVVPCGEVSLFDGEVCQFSYINLPAFMHDGVIDTEALRSAVHTAVILLDNAVEANISRMPTQESASMISSVRRIGVGLCGFADLLQTTGLPYASEEARLLAKNIMGLINYESKRASVALAKQRGPFPLFTHARTKRDLFLTPFAADSASVLTQPDWKRLEGEFEESGIRNLSTTILPPTGRSSLMAGVTPSIEPPFRLVLDSETRENLTRHARQFGFSDSLEPVFQTVSRTGSVQSTNLPPSVKKIFETASEIIPDAHVAMMAAFQRQIDDGISKTVNFPNQATVQDVLAIFKKSIALDLKGLTIYRDGCRTLQPKSLANTSEVVVIADPIYGPVKLSPRIAKLIASPLLMRLKGVRQNGAASFVDPRQSTTRFDHSVGTALLVQLLGGSESDQIGAVLHDVSHTAFSHVSDLVFGRAQQDYHETIKARILQSAEAKQTLRDCGIKGEEIDCPMGRGVDVNVDRLDYCVRDLRAVGGIFQPEYASIIHNVTMSSGGIIKCNNLETARLLFHKFLDANQTIYFDSRAEAANLFVAEILKRMLAEGLISEEDFLLTDDHLIQLIQKSPYGAIFAKLNPDFEVKLSQTATKYPIVRKLRFIDPQIIGLEGRLTDHCHASRARLETYLQTPTTVWYDLPWLDP